MLIVLSIYCGSASPGALLRRCGELGGPYPVLSIHSLALLGMLLGTGLVVLDASPSERRSHVRSGVLAAFAMTVFCSPPDPRIFLFTPASAAVAFTVAMLPGMILGHAAGWVLRGRSPGLDSSRVENERAWL